MPRTMRLQRLMLSALSVGASLLLISVNLPHRHEGAAAHPEQSCTACRMQGNLSATPPAPPALRHAPVLVALRRIQGRAARGTALIVRLSVPRAPPRLS